MSSSLTLAAASVRSALGPHTERDWSVPAGSLSWSCRETAVHIAHDLLAYAGQVAGGASTGYLPFDLTVRPAASNGEVLDVIVTCAELLEAAVTKATPSARAWHWGPVDPAGFAALGIDEMLVHTYDIRAGLGLPWEAPAELCSVVLERLFLQAPEGEPFTVLLWCTGRGPLGDRPRQTSWTLRAARD
jgi:hypothetical protein